MSALFLLVALMPFYALGAFPTGYLLAKVKGVNITAEGSGNIGATNVARVLGKACGIATLVGDVIKGSLGILLAQIFEDGDWFTASVAVVVVLGHCFSLPPFLKGGKGVATALGVILALEPLLSVVALIVFAGVFSVWRIVSLASITAALVVPTVALVSGVNEAFSIALAVVGLLVVARHEENIRRLIEGKEPRFSAKKREPAQAG